MIDFSTLPSLTFTPARQPLIPTTADLEHDISAIDISGMLGTRVHNLTNIMAKLHHILPMPDILWPTTKNQKK